MSDNNEIMLEARNIHKSFDSNHILKGVNLSVNKGDVVTILGPSGAGKTTFLRCLNFLERPQQGTVTIDGFTVDAEKSAKKDIYTLRQKTAMVFQQYNLFKNKTVLENVTEGLVYVRKIPRGEAQETARKYIDQVGLTEKLDAYPANLSGGQQQRVGIARALALNPDVILFDEPTSALDPELVGEILEIMSEIAKTGITMIVVTHEMQFAFDIANRIAVMDEGIIIEEGAPSDILVNAKEERTKQFLKKILPEFSYSI